ncbi:diketogulonate reductase-like aldo/keto reductase [Actinomadura coerulea]|uniref:Diketogulonate reductase-like aldo/keto reductase n=1 Tax=Actinomadura coerulea TaxID=46159 RepID=A0A7X0KZY9_9ACTN|nr:aldo/keto reductase [Actinomadura coerulea]MBB6396932.1 diketogulonate reductase-like aldo/keto reductase [Actinomadura coerulea]GGP95427.1 putative oxidoreductase [Actinomadura coerulea]
MTRTVNLPGGTGLPMIGFGTWQLRPKAAYASVREALEIGYRHVDTATLYRNEADVGRAVKDSGVDREEVFVTTKLRPQDARDARRTLESSLRLLGTGYVDLWLIHWPTGRDELVPTWRALLEAQDAGLVRNAGVSNYSPALIDRLTEATGRRPAVNQIAWSPAQHDPALLDEHRRRGIAVEGYSGLKNTDLRDPVLTEIAGRYGVTPAQVVLRWHLEHDIVILPRSSRREHIAANFDLEGFALTEEDVAAVDALARNA